MKRLFYCFVCFLLMVPSFTSCEIDEEGLLINEISMGKTDWKTIANDIVKDATTERDKVWAIYYYICENIAYDTDYEIYHAEECWEKKKGICEGYCRLFYGLAYSIGLDVTVVHGECQRGAHAWIRVKFDGKYHLLDPTWGAGTVSGKTFTKNLDHRHWWDVDPYWMMLTHYPDNYDYAMVDRKISKKEWMKSVPDITSKNYIKVDGKSVLYGFLDGKVTGMPTIYGAGIIESIIVDMPLASDLVLGKEYCFKYYEKDTKFRVSHSDCEISTAADGCITIKFIPNEIGALTLWTDNNKGVLGYNVIEE